MLLIKSFSNFLLFQYPTSISQATLSGTRRFLQYYHLHSTLVVSFADSWLSNIWLQSTVTASLYDVLPTNNFKFLIRWISLVDLFNNFFALYYVLHFNGLAMKSAQSKKSQRSNFNLYQRPYKTVQILTPCPSYGLQYFSVASHLPSVLFAQSLPHTNMFLHLYLAPSMFMQPRRESF